MDISIADVSLAVDDSGEPRVNIGDVTSGKGFAASAAIWGSGDGFLGIPNGPDGSNQAPQALMGQEGYQRFALAIRDPRWVGKAGTLAEGDRAVVSNCDAALRLTKAANTIGLQSTGASCVAGPSQVKTACGSSTLTVNGNSVTASATGVSASTPGGASLALSATSASVSYAAGPITVSASMSAAGLVLSFVGGFLDLCSISLLPGGLVTVVTSGGMTVDGSPVT